jgi:hypothetical protein
MDVCLMSVVCCQVQVSATGWSLVQRSPTDWCAVVCDLETSWMKRPWPTGGGGGCCAKIKSLLRTNDCFFKQRSPAGWVTRIRCFQCRRNCVCKNYLGDFYAHLSVHRESIFIKVSNKMTLFVRYFIPCKRLYMFRVK